MSYVYLYHDDYGYASLSYSTLIPSVSGTSYTAEQLFDFLRQHYTSWGGRVLFYGIEIIILKWGLALFRVTQACVITAILFTVYLLLLRNGVKGNAKSLAAITLCCWYGLLPIEIHNNGTYWFSASVGYIWPFLFVFLALLLHLSLCDKEVLDWRTIVVGLLYFIAGFSQEQIGVLGIVLVGGITCLHLMQNRNRNVLLLDVFALLFLVAGFLLLILAPGNYERLNNPIYATFRSMGIIEKISANLPGLLNANCGRHNLPLLFIWSILCSAVTWHDHRGTTTKHMVYRLVYIVCLFFSFMLAALLFPGLPKEFEKLFQFDLLFTRLFWILFLFISSLATLLFAMRKGYYHLMLLFVGGVFSQLSMLTAPSINFRSALIFLIPLFALMTCMFLVLATVSDRKIISIVAITAVCSAAGYNAFTIVQGYRGNSHVMETNHRFLRNASNMIKASPELRYTIQLPQIPNSIYAGSMPYTPGSDYINWWIKEYYDIPSQVELVWRKDIDPRLAITNN